MTDHLNIWLAIFPIGDSDPLHLPVRNLEQAFPFYERYLGCTIVNREDQPSKEITFQRDQVRLVLAENGQNPEDHSYAISVSDVDGLYQKLHAQSLDISDIHKESYARY